MHPALIGPLLIASMNLSIKEIQLDQISQSVSQLASPQPSRRSQARQDLMGLSFEQLPMLHYVLAKQPIVSPAQSGPLHDVIMQVVIRNRLMQFPRVEGTIIGIMMRSLMQINPDNKSPIYRYGIISEPTVGLIANRYLENGDLILAIGQPNRMVSTSSTEQFRSIVQLFSPGDRITLLIQRGPVRFETTFPLDPRLKDMDVVNGEYTEGYQKASADAEEYWQTHFAKLFAEQES